MKLKHLIHKNDLDKELHYWRSIKDEMLRFGEGGYRARVEDLEMDKEQLELMARKREKSDELVIGEIDQDGFVLSYFGPLKYVPTVSKDQFLARKRGSLKVISKDGNVGVKKEYHGNKLLFLNELRALHKLGLAGCNVPAIMDVDFDNLSLTVSYILGPVLREELAKKGAVLRDRDVDGNPAFNRLAEEDRWLKRIEEGRRVLYVVVDSQFVESLFTELKQIHAEGFFLNDIKYGNVVVEKRSGKPYWIDFDNCMDCSEFGKYSFRILRDKDIERFNLHFNTQMPTYESLRNRIKSKQIPFINDWYPVYLGAGLRIGPIWEIGTGYGRWHYIVKKNLPNLKGKRILDLGANNAFNSIEMLRHGAAEVIGVELNEKYIVQGNFLKAALEWADNKLYNFRYIQADMREVPKMNLGRFDMVTAFCSLYYLDDDSISKLTQFVSATSDLFVLQCNVDSNTEREYSYTFAKASVEYALGALKNNGFPATEIISPPGYSRPLVIGAKERKDLQSA